MTTPNDPYNQQPGYPPQAPPLSESELRRPARPKSVDTAYLLWLIAAGLGILGNLIGFATAEAVARQTLEAMNVDTSAVGAIQPSYGSLIFSLVVSVLWILVVMQMRKGANWARIVLTVLGVLAIIGGLFGLVAIGILFSVGFLGVIQALLSLAQLVLTIAAIVFMFKADSNQYFKAS
ncbi:hypothetical protein ACIGNX_07670 [Actinosynnema sp. NPDC053489]|uniref:hypothetical protein n=1 Tax=Actinosynnema sp. NPDC053489 TaxID=3363916 RepID=UPI0037C88012